MQYYNEFPINTGKTNQYEMNEDILQGIYAQFKYMTSILSQCFLIRFDLHLPKDSQINPLQENKIVSEFFNRFVNKYLKRAKNHKHVAYCWVREVEKKKHCHYHCYIIVDRHKTQSPGSVASRSGVMGKAADIWEEVSGGGTLRIADGMQWGEDMRRGHEISAEDQMEFCKKYNRILPKLTETDRCFYAVSYLAKARGKGVRHGTKVRDYGMSRVPKPVSRNSDEAA